MPPTRAARWMTVAGSCSASKASARPATADGSPIGTTAGADRHHVAVPHADPPPLRVAYTMEACWHRVPGGTAVAAVEVARRLVDRPDVRILGVAGQHRRMPAPPFPPPMAGGQPPPPRPG